MNRRPIQVNIAGHPVRTCDSWFEVAGYALACWLRGRWPFDRRRASGEGPERERRAAR